MPSHKVYEDEDVFAFLDIHPVNPGHTLVVPKEHFPDYLSATDEALAVVSSAIKKITPKILKAVGSQSWNLGVNSGPESGQIIPHLHFHIMPRFSGDEHHLFHGKPEIEVSIEETAKKIRNIP